MAVPVIESLEPVQIEKHHGEKAAPLGRRELVFEEDQGVAPVWETGEGIGERAMSSTSFLSLWRLSASQPTPMAMAK